MAGKGAQVQTAVPPPIMAFDPTLSPDQIDQLWIDSDEAGLLQFRDASVTIWISRYCRAGVTDLVRRSLDRYLHERGAVCTWLDARDGIDGDALKTGLLVDSPLFPNGVRIPATWLQRTRLVVVSEIRRHAVWGFLGAMAAQAEPLEASFPQPWFRRAALLCEAQRLGGADLSVVVWHSSGQEACLVAPSALLADTLFTRGAELPPGDVPHLATWRRHFVAAPDERWTAWPSTAPAVQTLRGFGIRRAVVSSLGPGLSRLDEAWDDLTKSSGNLYRIPAFVTKRMREIADVG
jgi:hypothetical protein